MNKSTIRYIPNLKYREILLATALIGSQLPVGGQAIAQPANQCTVLIPVSNQAEYSYRVQTVASGKITTSSQTISGLTTPAVKTTITLGDKNLITPAGIENSQGNLAVGTIAGALNDSLTIYNFSNDESKIAALSAIKTWTKISTNPTLIEIGNTAKEEIIAALPDKKTVLEGLGTTPETTATAVVLLPLKYTLISSGLTPTQATEATQSLQGTETISEAFSIISQKLPNQSDRIARVQKIWQTDLENIRKGVPVSVAKGDNLAFNFRLTNPTTRFVSFQVPTLENLQATGVTGPGTVKGVQYQTLNPDGTTSPLQTATPGEKIVVSPKSDVLLKVLVEVGEVTQNGAGVRVKIFECDGTSGEQTIISSPTVTRLTDPAGKINSCTGGDLADYNGFSVGLYEPDPNDPTGGIRGAALLTGTEVPDIPGNNRPKGLLPNAENSNPFFLTNSDRGRYSFLLDKSKGQLQPGRTYILLVNPPARSGFGQRRIRLAIGTTNTRADGTEVVNYTATALDGLPISLIANTGQDVTQGDRQTQGQFGSFVQQGEILVEDADSQGLSIAAISLSTSVCESEEIQITKTSDRAAAEPGDTVIYRLSIKNLTDAAIANVKVTDDLPLGFRFVPNSVKAEIASASTPITTNTNGSQVTFELPNTRLPAKGVLNIAYAATLTPDAIRGSGENIANVNGQRADNLRRIKDGPAIYKMRIRPGILTDSGTIVGKVFVDKNFDGEQQPGEAGVPNVVIFMDDGNRIVTDANGLFSVANVQPGARSGVLDLTSLSGYTLAPNVNFSAGNSQSRLVRLSPGGLVRMNFGVTPTAQPKK